MPVLVAIACAIVVGAAGVCVWRTRCASSRDNLPVHKAPASEPNAAHSGIVDDVVYADFTASLGGVGDVANPKAQLPRAAVVSGGARCHASSTNDGLDAPPWRIAAGRIK